MTIPEIRANLEAYQTDRRIFSPGEWAGMVEDLLDANADLQDEVIDLYEDIENLKGADK